jgi:hypothetical protein
MQTWTAAELAIYNAMQEVEKMDADVRLTHAVVKLSEAQNLVADFIENIPIKDPTVTELEKLSENRDQ